MPSIMQAADSREESQQVGSSDATYVFRQLISNISLSQEEEDGSPYVTTAEFWDGNLYIGTSHGEVLHFVSLPPEDGHESEPPIYIIASRTQPVFTTKQTSPYHLPGVEQILLLPSVNKACVLCNGTLTFYSLPELSPAFGGKIKQGDCTWVAGLDKNLEDDGAALDDEIVIVICLRQKLRLVKIGEEARKIRDIELGGCLNIERRGDLACVADGSSYSLLDVVNQRKIDLFPISSVVEPAPLRSRSPAYDDRQGITRPASRSFSSTGPTGPAQRALARGHDRIVSVGSEPRNNDRLRPESPSHWPARRSSRSGTPTSPRGGSPAPNDEEQRALPPTLGEAAPGTQEPERAHTPLIPHIASPTANEFLLSTGTTFEEPGVGMFVNLDGDVVRGTIEFSSYPESMVLDGGDQNVMPSPDLDARGEGYVLAIVRQHKAGPQYFLQIQRWDLDASDNQASKEWIALPNTIDSSAIKSEACVKLRRSITMSSIPQGAVTEALSLRRVGSPGASDSEQDQKREMEEDKLVERFSSVSVHTLLFAKDSVWWVMRNPLLVQLDSRLAVGISLSNGNTAMSISREHVAKVFNSLRGQDAKSEFEFFTLNYIRQKAALLLLIDLVIKTAEGMIVFEHDKRFTEETLVASDIEPRLVLSVIPVLCAEVVQGPQGIWAPGGLCHVLQLANVPERSQNVVQEARGAYGDNLLQLCKQYLLVWRRKKGFGSVADEYHVFQTVDAALLHVLLLLDGNTSRGPAIVGSVRAELNELVDHGVDCFERAVDLLEQHKRLYILSRLYQSRKMVAKVLATWKRILEGEHDEGGEMIEGESDVRKYLTKIKDVGLVKEYGAWLAKRNPRLGVQVFADDHSRVKFTPKEAVELLKEQAPGAVKEYLEHLVFGKNLVQYVNDLITFYLDTVVTEIEGSETARSILTSSYETYRALKPPKPTYRQFVTDNALDAEWFRNRLRLLQLIGGSHNAASRYDVAALAERLEPFSDVLVPEMIILNGRRGEHVEALRLLTHGLGDYDTAIRYCLLGGSSIFHPSSGMLSQDTLPTKEQQETLFQHLLHEFMKLSDESERIERTAELLERFGAWFDVANVLALIPDSWSVELLSGFIVHALRRLVRERNETVVVKALSSAQALRSSAELIEKMEELGPTVVHSNAPDSAYHSMGSQEG